MRAAAETLGQISLYGWVRALFIDRLQAPPAAPPRLRLPLAALG